MPRIKGFDGCRIAKLTSDTTSGVTYEAPVLVIGGQELDIDPNVKESTTYADDGVYESDSTFENAKIKLVLAECPLNLLERLQGGTFNAANGEYTFKSNDQAPYIAIMGRALRSDGSYRRFKIVKVMVSKVKEGYKTLGENDKGSPVEIEGTAVNRIFDKVVYRKRDTGDDTWFNAVEGTLDTTPPTISTTSPANNATGVAVSVTVQWTFSEEIQPGTVAADNFFVFRDSDGVLVAGTLVYDAVTRRVTFTPSANLAALTAYRAVATAGVRDMTGNAMVANSVTKFTTA
ncbi:MAG: major tail protein [Thermincolia bacterium]